jgi:hypothetical protein
MPDPIIILGFGRSGTTWLSDIISKTTGSLILFEPLHPSVTDLSREYAYSHIGNNETDDVLKDFLNKVINKQYQKMWLLRNHVPTRLEETSPDFLELLWRECNVIGMKGIRMNFMIEWLYKNISQKIVFIMRHPCAVISSIKNRSNFWEFGWPDTYNLFLEKTIRSLEFSNHPIQQHLELVESAQTYVEKLAIMWSITHAISLPMLDHMNLPFFTYENLYTNPFEETRKILSYLGIEGKNIHPSHLFTPSMTTMKTFHGMQNLESKIHEKMLSIFWEKTLDTSEIDAIMKIVSRFGLSFYSA